MDTVAFPDEATPPVAGARFQVPAGTALPRPRLERALDRIWPARAGLVQGPAGSGKTTLLAHFAREQRARVAWYRAEEGLATPDELVDRLRQALDRAGTAVARRTGRPHDLAALLPAVAEPALLVVDDVHVLGGEVADAVLDALIVDGPDWLRVLLASRAAPTVDLPQLRLEERLVELGGDDLRFRPWETERLFRDLYGDPLLPEDAAELTRRTEGWAAGLQMFHLAARGRSRGQRRDLVTGISTRSRFVRDYLVRNVLRDLDDDSRRFLVDSCVLGLLTGPLCDALLDRSGSGALLRELERRQVFTSSVDGGCSYRYHEVLRGFLEQLLVAEVGEPETRRRFGRAGRLLEAEGAVAEALRAYAHAGDWTAAARLLGGRGGQLADSGAVVCADLASALPGWLLDDDPWLLLARARQEVAAGSWIAAVQRYRRAEQAFGAGPAANRCRRELVALLAWTEPARACPEGWPGPLRQATRRDPAAAADGVAGTGGGADVGGTSLARGVAALLAGDLSAATAVLRAGARATDAEPLLAAGLELAARLADALRGAPAWPDDVESRVEALGVPALTRVARLVAALGGRAADDDLAATVERECEHAGDQWGAALASLVRGLAPLLAGEPVPKPLEDAAEGFAALDAAVLQAWALALAAVARAARRDPGAVPAAELAVRRARACACPPARALALAALARHRLDGGGTGERARALADRCGLAPSRLWSAALPEGRRELASCIPLPRAATAAADRGRTDLGTAPPAPPFVLRCFGGLRVDVGGSPLDLSVVRPRARSALRVLALRAGSGVHRELLADALWPDDPPAVAARGVQVAVSSLRRLLAGAAEVRRDGEGYVLELPEHAFVDVLAFRSELSAAQRVVAADPAAAADRLAAALRLYAGDLFPEEGPAEWLQAEREQCRAEAVRAGVSRAEACLRLGRTGEAVAACEDGLRLDRFHDPLWRLLLTAHERAGNSAAATLAAARYRRSLEELGVADA